jgi:hypothetical protein
MKRLTIAITAMLALSQSASAQLLVNGLRPGMTPQQVQHVLGPHPKAHPWSPGPEPGMGVMSLPQADLERTLHKTPLGLVYREGRLARVSGTQLTLDGKWLLGLTSREALVTERMRRFPVLAHEPAKVTYRVGTLRCTLELKLGLLSSIVLER